MRARFLDQSTEGDEPSLSYSLSESMCHVSKSCLGRWGYALFCFLSVPP